MKICVSSFHSFLHESAELENFGEEFFRGIEAELGCPLVRTSLDDYDCDLKLIYIESGGSEGLFLQNINKLREPYYFLTSGANNSLAASLEIVTYLNNLGKKSQVLHGDSKFIANRIKELAFVGSVKNKLDGVNLGVIGKPSDWLISSIPDYHRVKDVFGINLVDVPLKNVLNYRQNKNDLGVDAPFDSAEMAKATVVYDAVCDVIEQNKLSGVTIRCFDLLDTVKSTGCLALAKLNKDGITGCCEGDVMAMITMQIVRAAFGQSSFQANPSRIDTSANQIVFAHCTVPFDMLESYKLATHFESDSGVAVKGELHKKSVTVCRISSDLKRFYVCEGTILSNLNESKLCRTQINVQMDGDVSELLTHPCGNHHVIFYGRHRSALTLLLTELLNY